MEPQKERASTPVTERGLKDCLCFIVVNEPTALAVVSAGTRVNITLFQGMKESYAAAEQAE